MAIKRAADYLAERLYEAGCRFAFGIPGGEVLTLVDALETAGIRFILTKHENNAGFMAEGTYQMTGAPGIVVATLGPGAANAVNVTANALQDKVPLIILSGCVDEDEALSYTHQVIDHQKLFCPISKGTFRLTAKGADIVADKAVNLALDDRPGPVQIDVPISIAAEQVDIAKLSRRAATTASAPRIDETFGAAMVKIDQGDRPVIVAGLDIMNHNADAELRALVEHLHAPVITTYKAKGVIPEDHPLSLGGAGLSPKADARLVPLLHAADTIILAGYDPIEMRTGWRDIWDPNRQHVVELASVANDHYMHQSSFSFVGNTKAALSSLINHTKPKTGWPNDMPATTRADLRADFSADAEWGPAKVIALAREVMPRNSIATADSGAHRILQSQMWECFEPRSLLQSSGLCTMGCAVPLALGARLADPDRPAVAFIGDAGMLMILGELATCAEVGIPIIVIVFVDASLALIELKQRGNQMVNRGVDFARYDFAALAGPLGGSGVTVANEAELISALDSALTDDKFTVIACEIDRQSYDGVL
jgi:acetolactate synthase-1/2/3 large subunit